MSRRKKNYKPSSVWESPNRYNVKLGLRIDGLGGREYPRSIYREYADYINRSYVNIRYELLAKDVPFDKVLETIKDLKERGL